MSPRPPRERDFLARVAQLCPHAGDDLAVLPSTSGSLLAGIDPALDGVHFRLAACGGRAAGQKAANRNLSDVAAMGGQPVGLLLSLVVPRTLGEQEIYHVLEGVAEAAQSAGCSLVGGDYAVWDGPLAVTVAVLGEAVRPVPRQGVRVGQRLYVTGPLGGSIRGRHLTFKPRLAEGRALAQQAESIGLSAMMDLSDGIAADLPRLLGGLGARLRDVPVHDDARQLDGDPLDHALGDGEDYELLFAADRPPEGVDAYEIGLVTDGGGITVERAGGAEPVRLSGFQHGE